MPNLSIYLSGIVGEVYSAVQSGDSTTQQPGDSEYVKVETKASKARDQPQPASTSSSSANTNATPPKREVPKPPTDAGVPYEAYKRQSKPTVAAQTNGN